ncbi:uncharacterized protein HaLaN_15343, partial [Haematococcus lacustris]
MVPAYDQMQAGKPSTLTKWGAWVSSTHCFDATLFGLSAQEAAMMDPAQRLLLEETAAAVAGSGRSLAALHGSDAGVFVGCIWSEWGEALALQQGGAGRVGPRWLTSSQVVTGNGPAFMAGRLSFTFGATGTPLGDPIEIGAAAAVLCGPWARWAPVALGASKASQGHAEPAAGMVGFQAGLLELQQAAAAPFMHLRSLNPHVAAALEQAGGASSQPLLVAARQSCGMPSKGQAGTEASCGVSGFAFQGTNAHVVLKSATIERSNCSSDPSPAAQPLWQRNK